MFKDSLKTFLFVCLFVCLGREISVVEYLPCMWETLGSIPSTTKKKQRGLLCSYNTGYEPPATCWQAKQLKQEVGQVPPKKPVVQWGATLTCSTPSTL